MNATLLAAVRRQLHSLRIPVAMLLMACPPSPSAAAQSEKDPLILNPSRYEILSGRYSVFSKFQANLQRVLTECGKGEPAVVAEGNDPDGRIKATMQQAVLRALDCDALRAVPADSPARKGQITESVWRAVMGDAPIPSVDDRANALVLSFEATDFGDGPEWNLCQDGQRDRNGQSNGKPADSLCYNASDPCSFVTWGPRGATAGSGRELQWILWIIWKRDPALMRRAFGSEFANVQRFFHLEGNSKGKCDGPIPVKQFVCAIWLDPARRTIWENALVELGHSEIARNAYSELYALDEFDGSKMRDYFSLWREVGLTPSEIDYAFFLDRATHLGGPPENEDSAAEHLSACMQHEPRSVGKHAAARRCLSRLQPHATQAVYRLGRDVAYFIDAYPEGALSKNEIRAWAEYVPLSATYNFGLSDAVAYRLARPAHKTSLGPDLPRPNSRALTASELSACPSGILTPIHRMPPK